ncbi:MAG: DNA polymerase III subunit alpha, partial [Candidatus Omnitrophica bacterium]|nr:DNA polymerase III subunit alpha [Candidatus Omnitrophota bacterium]
GVLYGAIEFYKKAKEAGIKPIIGAELYIAPEGRHFKRPNIDKKRWHLVVLAKNKTGYQNLIQLITKAHLEGFYYKPRVDKELLREYSEGLIAMSACLHGEIPKAILAGNIKKAEKVALEYQDIFGQGNFYLELMPHYNFEEQVKVNKALKEISKKTGIPLVATNDVHYINPEDAEAQEILMCIQTNHTIEDENRLTMDDDFSMKSQEEMIKSFKDVPEAIRNTQKIAEQCNLEIELGKVELPYFPLPKGATADGYLRKLCLEGFKQRYKKISSEAKKRLDYELEVIKKTGFASYFLIVQDFVNWAKNRGIVVGPGRGSVGGSLVSYLLNITNVDPLKFGLLFERFLNPERISMPDIDLDFADTRRDEVIDYVAQKYGRDHMAQIITFGTMAARAVIRDVGRALNYTYIFCDELAKAIPFSWSLEQALRKVPELKESYETDSQTKRLIDLARKLEGVARHASTHACGVVITKGKIDNYTPRQRASRDDETIVTQYEMHAIEDLGLLKMDFLGLKNLTIIENAISIIKKLRNKEINIDDIPLNDKKVFKLFQKANTTGVFQLESSGMKRYLQQLKPTEFEDITAMVALYRPGPMELIPTYIARKHGKEKISYIHPKLEPILKSTYGIAVYQEQLLRIVRDLAGFSLSEADVLRKAVGKKIKKLLDEQADKMIQGMVKNKIDKRTAKKIWEFIEPFARYGFNRSHATCYALIGYQTAYLKAHYTSEFMTALMNSEQNDVDRIAVLVSEAKKEGIDVLPPDINESLENFTLIPPAAIRFGLAAIKNVGHNVVEAIVKEREKNGRYKSIGDFLDRVESKDLNKKSLESLVKAGAFDQLGERVQMLANVEEMLNYSREIHKAKSNGQTSLFDSTSLQSSNLFTLRAKDISEFQDGEKLIWEKELLGIYVSEHPLDRHQSFLKKNATNIKTLSVNQAGKRVRIAGIINTIKKFITKVGKPMLFVELEDLTGKIEALVFPSILERDPTVWQEGKILILSGRLSDKDDQLKILCNEAKEIENHEN